MNPVKRVLVSVECPWCAEDETSEDKSHGAANNAQNKHHPIPVFSRLWLEVAGWLAEQTIGGKEGRTHGRVGGSISYDIPPVRGMRQDHHQSLLQSETEAGTTVIWRLRLFA